MLFKRLIDHVVVAEAANALARLLLHSVVSALLGATNATFTGHFEPLCRGFSGFHFRHDIALPDPLLGAHP